MAAALLTIFAHGFQAGDLGLYWDDAEQLMQGLQAVDHRSLAFVFSDTARSLLSERPFAYLAFAITRLAFASSLVAVHWVLVGLLALNAVLLGHLARTMVDDGWFVFAVAATFVLYPLAPLQAIWPATVHYQVACFLAFVAMLAAGKSMHVERGQAARWLTCAALAYAMSLLTHEATAFIPLAFTAPHVFFSRRGARTAMLALVVLGGVLALFGLWRSLLLPAYGQQHYSPSIPTLSTIAYLAKTLSGMRAALFPWPAALGYVIRSTTIAQLGAAFIVGTVTWLVSQALLAPDAGTARHPAPGYPRGVREWLQAAGIGISLLFAALMAVALSPIGIELQFSASYGPRGNFVAVPGIAIALPALLMLVVRAACFAPTAFALTALAVLIGAGAVGGQGHGTLLTHRSADPVVLGRYSVPYAAVVTVYVLAVAVVGAMAIVRLLRRRPRRDAVPGAGPCLPPAGRQAASVALAVLAFLGSLVHFDVKQGFVMEWVRHKTMLAALRELAPRVQPDTVIVIATERDRRAPYAAHYEVSSYLLAIYDDWSVIGNTVRHLRFYRDGVESTYHGTPGRWFPHGVKGLVSTRANEPVGRIAYDRLLLFAYDGAVLRPLTHLDVTTVDGEQRRLANNVGRVEPGPALVSPIWLHITR